MSTDEYLDGVTDFQRSMQDSLNRDLAARQWSTPVSTAYVNRVVQEELLRGNRNKTRWEVVTDMHTAPPKIRLYPYEIRGSNGRVR